MIKLNEDRVKEFTEAMVRLVSYGATAFVGWKITNEIAEREMANNDTIANLKIKYAEIQERNVRMEIEELKNK